MREIHSGVRWFFLGVRLFLPLIPRFMQLAFQEMSKSTINYWKNSQSIVDELAESYKNEAMKKMTSEYSVHVFWLCYSLASFLYLVGWLAVAWLSVEAFRLLMSAIF
jgi:hypothetical protein